MKTKYKFPVFVLALILLLAACQSVEQTPAPLDLSFTVNVLPASAQEAMVEAGVIAGNSDIPADPEFNGVVELYGPDEKLRSKAIINELPQIDAGEVRQILSFSSEYPEGTYIVAWGAEGYGSVIATYDLSYTESGMVDVQSFRSSSSGIYPPDLENLPWN